MVQVTRRMNGEYDYQNVKTGEDFTCLDKNEIIKLIKRDIGNGLVVAYPQSDFDIDDFV